MRLFRKKEQVVVERRQRFSSLVPAWFRSQERCGSNSSLKSEINAANEDGMTRLHIASIEGSLSTVQKLLHEGADIDSKISSHGTDAGYSALHCAVKEGNPEMVKLLLKNNASVDSESGSGITPLHVAAETGNVPIAEALLNHGASIYSESTSQESHRYIPLHFALKKCHLGMVKLLLASGANRGNYEAQNKYSETTFRVARCTEDYTIIAYVFMCHLGFNMKNSKISLLDAVNGSEMEYTNIARHVSKWIFSTFSNINSELLLSALLHSAVELGYLKIVKDFLKWGVDIQLQHPMHAIKNSEGNFGHTLLHTATKNWHLDIAKLLISHGADVNFKDNNQRTPIFFAIESLDVKMTKLLLSHGANIGTEN